MCDVLPSLLALLLGKEVVRLAPLTLQRVLQDIILIISNDDHDCLHS